MHRSSWIENLGIACQLILIASFFSPFLQCIFFEFLILFSMGDYFLHKMAGIRLQVSFFSFLFEIPSFLESIPWNKINLFFLSAIAGSIFLLFLPPVKESNILSIILLGSFGLVPFLFLVPNIRESNLFFLWELDLIGRFSFRHFRFRADYPILRLEKPISEKNQRFHIKVKKEEKPHIIFLFLESFRAKNVGCLGCPLNLTPSFDKWSKEGILFSQFHSNGTHTAHSMISSLFGVFPMLHPSYLHPYLSIPFRGIPQILKENNYENGMILGGLESFASWERFFKLNDFQQVIGKKSILAEYPSAESMSWGVHDEWIYKKAYEWLKAKSNPAFLALLTATHHHPWTLPNSYSKRLGDLPYYQTLAYADWALGKWLKNMDESGLMEKSLIFIFGDHGQTLGERKEKSFVNQHLYQENIHVPLLLLAKGRIEKPSCFSYPCSQVDLLPTLLDLLRIESVHHGMGESLFLKERVNPQFYLYPSQESLIALRQDSWKCILNLTSGKKELFNLEKDPDEREDLSKNHSLIKKMEEKAFAQLNFLHRLYKTKSFAPPRTYTASLNLDFSKTYKLKKSTLGKLRKKGSQINSLNFSHQLFITDEFLEKFSVFWPHLSKITLSHSVFATDRGVQAILSSCKELEEIYLQGLDELTGNFQSLLPNLKALNLLDCKALHPNSIICWMSKLDSLSTLGIDGENFLEADWDQFFEILPPISCLFLQNGIHLRTEMLARLWNKNIWLQSITFENCPEIKDECFASLKNPNLHSLSISSCPKITSHALYFLQDLSLKVLSIKNCPRIEKKAIEDLENKGIRILSMP